MCVVVIRLSGDDAECCCCDRMLPGGSERSKHPCWSQQRAFFIDRGISSESSFRI